MPNWVAVIVGVVIGGGIGILADWLRHRRFARERTVEKVVERRISAYSELWGHVVWLAENFQIIAPFGGFEHLRSPKQRKISPQFFKSVLNVSDKERLEKDKRRAEEIQQRLREICEFVRINEIFLSTAVSKTFYKYIPTLLRFRLKAQALTDDQMRERVISEEQFDRIFSDFHDKIGDAIKKELKGAGINVSTAAERKKAWEEGDRILEEIALQRKDKQGGNKTPNETD